MKPLGPTIANAVFGWALLGLITAFGIVSWVAGRGARARYHGRTIH